MPSRTQGLEEAERESRVGGMAEGADVPRGRTGRRAGRRDRDAAREQREVFQSRDGSRPGQSIEPVVTPSANGRSRKITRRRDALVRAAKFFPPTGRERHGARLPRETLRFFPSHLPARVFLVEQPPVPVVAIAPSRPTTALRRERTLRAEEPDDGGRRVARS